MNRLTKAELIISYFTLKKEINKFLDDIKNKRISKQEAKKYAHLYWEFCRDLHYDAQDRSYLKKELDEMSCIVNEYTYDNNLKGLADEHNKNKDKDEEAENEEDESKR